jgi:serine/threonine protein kinase
MMILEDRYEIIASTSFGTCGEVFKGRDKSTGDLVAVKRIKNHSPDIGFPMNSMREIKSLRALDHPNIVRLHGVHTGRDQGSVYLVFEYCEYDLAALLVATALSPLQVRCYLRQIFVALGVLSIRQWLHRDLKPANILITPRHIIKLADFGLAKQMDPSRKAKFTNEVVTIWYRPPELLMGSDRYGPEIDVWSAGCIFYEMLTRNVLFRSMSGEAAQEIDAIFKIHGFPGAEVWEAWENLPQAMHFRTPRYENCGDFSKYLDSTLPPESESAKDLLVRMLEYDARKRISPEAVLDHPYIKTHGDQIMPENIPPLRLAETHQQMPRVRAAGAARGKVRPSRKRAPPP